MILVASLVEKPDRDVVRFIWVWDTSKPAEGSNLRIMRFARVPFGIISAPFILLATIHHHLSMQNSPLASELRRNTYADNALLGATSTDEALMKAKMAKTVFKSANMNLREFVSNDAVVYKEFGDDPKIITTKFLGIPWNLADDVITLKFPEKTDESPTKRKILRIVATVYDPLGLTSPCTLWAKLLIQNLWQRQVEWDSELDEFDTQQWREFMNEFGGCKIPLPRRIPVSLEQNFEIHVFVDASKLAYAACVYCKSLIDKRISLIFAKTRIRPVKVLTIPKLELMAALIGSRSLLYIISHLAEEHKPHIQKTYLWSDSRCVLYWIKNETKLLKRFVENRVKEIRQCKATFRYVPTESNPADIASRGSTPDQLQNSNLWWHGPSFLSQDENLWPKNEIPEQIPEDNEFETWDAIGKDSNFVAAENKVPHFDLNIIQLYNPQHFSTWKILNRSIAYVLTFLKQILIKSKTAQIFFVEKLRLNIQAERCTASEVKAAERIIVKQCQCQNPPSQKEIHDLNLIFDNDKILLCRGRIESPSFQLPVFMPQKAIETTLLIIDSHIRVMHAGTQATLCYLRNSYWIPKGRNQVKLVIKRHCFICRRYNAMPFALPKMSD